jgi:protein-S-isoprenylcysteine O-methyltransferase Ste14
METQLNNNNILAKAEKMRSFRLFISEADKKKMKELSWKGLLKNAVNLIYSFFMFLWLTFKILWGIIWGIAVIVGLFFLLRYLIQFLIH